MSGRRKANISGRMGKYQHQQASAASYARIPPASSRACIVPSAPYSVRGSSSLDAPTCSSGTWLHLPGSSQSDTCSTTDTSHTRSGGHRWRMRCTGCMRAHSVGYLQSRKRTCWCSPPEHLKRFSRRRSDGDPPAGLGKGNSRQCRSRSSGPHHATRSYSLCFHLHRYTSHT